MGFLRRVKEQAHQPQERVEPLNDAEREWVADNVAAASESLSGDLTAEGLDALWAALLREEPADPNPEINMVGIAFGHLLVERLGVAWVALTDERGTELAVRGRADFTVFPTNFVAKRYAGRETGFIAPAFDEMVRAAESLS
jgi:Domain of unknown function (DUF3806)